ncbi:unnamed protein product, partial [marine sediment metagenome]
SPSNNTYAVNTVTVNLSGDATHHWYYIEPVDTQNQTWTNSEDRTLADGSYTLHTYGNDTAGLETHTQVSFTIDITPPEITILSPQHLEYGSVNITILFSGQAKYYWYSIEPFDSQNQSWITSTNRTLFDGTFTLHAYGNDTVGNIGYEFVEFLIVISGPKIFVKYHNK